MSESKQSFDAKDPSEIIPLTFDFGWLTSAPQSPVITVTRFSGGADDSNLSLMLAGAPQVVGSKVLQKVISGVAGVNYLFRCQVDSPEGLRWVLAGILPVKTA
jgi:hypothetical protein